MGRKRKQNNQLPAYLYKVNRKRPYKLHLPAGGTRSFANIQDALAAWSTYYGDSGESVIIGRVMDRYMVHELPKLRERTQVDYRLHITHLRPVFGEMDIRHLRPHHLYKYQRLRGQASVHQANREMAVMSNICKMAIKEGLIDLNPCRQVSKLSEYARDRDVTGDEFEAVFNHADERTQVAMMLTAITGIRRGDIVGLLRNAFSDDGLRYVESKSQRTAQKVNGRKRHWEWTDTLHWCHERALALHTMRPSVYLLCERDGSAIKEVTLSKRFKAAVDKAIEAGELDEGFHFHDLRAMAANESSNPFELLAHADGSVTVRNYLNRRARKSRPVK